jgi:quinol monooxygenase YgiN
MSHLTVTAEIHGLAGRDADLRTLLSEHAAGLAAAPGCLGAIAAAPLGAEAGEYVLEVRWHDEAALRAHYATAEYTHYVENIGELLARPSDVRIAYVDREIRATADLSDDPTRQG